MALIVIGLLVFFAPVLVLVGLLMGVGVVLEIVALPFRVLAWLGMGTRWVVMGAGRALLRAWGVQPLNAGLPNTAGVWPMPIALGVGAAAGGAIGFVFSGGQIEDAAQVAVVGVIVALIIAFAHNREIDTSQR